MRIVAVSDTHGQHTQLTVPAGDVLIHAGDFSKFGNWTDAENFLNWFSRLPHLHKLLICGNHEIQVEKDMARFKAMIPYGVTYLHHDEVLIESIKFFGSPYTPRFFNWAFNADRGSELRQLWAMIPDDTNVLITHGPPLGICDYSRFGHSRMGCEDLLNRISQLAELKLHIFGHNHGGFGQEQPVPLNALFCNVASCDEEYQITNQPTVVDI